MKNDALTPETIRRVTCELESRALAGDVDLLDSRAVVSVVQELILTELFSEGLNLGPENGEEEVADHG